MPQDPLFVDKRKFIRDLNSQLDEEHLKYNSPSQTALAVRNITEPRDAERMRASALNRVRMDVDNKEQGGTFGSQLIWGLASTATVAPSLWEHLGGFDKGSMGRALVGEQADIDFWDLTPRAKAGHAVGAGLGMLVPFGAAGKVVKATGYIGAKAVGGATRLLGLTPRLSKVAAQELAEGAAKLSGKSATVLSDEAASKVISVAQKSIGRKGRAAAAGLRKHHELYGRVAKAEIKENLTKVAGVADDAADDIANLALETVKYNKPGNVHALLEASVGKMLPGMGGDLLAAYSYDALLGATYGFATAAAHSYSDALWGDAQQYSDSHKNLSFFGPEGYAQDAEWNAFIKEGMTHGVYLGFLGPVRHFGKGTAKPLLTIPRPWNQNKGKINMVVGGLMRSLKPIKNMKDREIRGTLRLINRSSEGSLKHYKIPALDKHIGKTNWWEQIPGDELPLVMAQVRRAFRNNAPRLLAKETMKELGHSLPRMGAGAFTMNLQTVHDVWKTTHGANVSDRVRHTLGTAFGEGWEDISANIVMGAIFTRQGRSFRRQDPIGSQKWYGARKGKKIEEYIEGKSGYLAETTAALQRFGLSKSTKHQIGQRYYRDVESPEKYRDSILINMMDTHPDYRRMNERVRELEIDPSKPKSENPDAKNIDEAIHEALTGKDYSKKEKSMIREQYSIAMSIMKHLDGFQSGETVLREMTSKEAVSFVKELSNTPIMGKRATMRGENNIHRLLDNLQSEASIETTAYAHNNIVGWFTNIADALGVKYQTLDDGRIVVPKTIRLPYKSADTTNPDSQQKQNVILTWNQVVEWGVRNRWIVEQNIGAEGKFDATGGDWGKAVKVHRERVDEHHRIVYGESSTREQMKDQGTQDDLILGHDVWHAAYDVSRKWQQAENVTEFLTGSPDKVSTNQSPESVKKLQDKIDQLFTSGKTKLNGDSDNKTKLDDTELSELSEFVSNFSRINKLGSQQKSGTDKDNKIDIEQAVEVKEAVEGIFGDSFKNADAMQYIEAKLVDKAISKLDIPGASREIKRAILSLTKNREFTESIGTLRDPGDMKYYFDQMEAKGKDVGEVQLLREFYGDIADAVTNSGSKMVNMNSRESMTGKEDTIWSALRVAEFESRREKALAGMEDAHTMIVDGSDFINRVRGMAESLMDADGKIVDKELHDMYTRDGSTVKTLTEQMTVALNDNNVNAIRALRKLKPEYDSILDAIENSAPDTPHADYQTKLAKMMREVREWNLKPDRKDVEDIIESQVSDKEIPMDKVNPEQENKISPNRFISKYLYNTADYVKLERALSERLQTENSGIHILDSALNSIESSYRQLNREVPQAVLDKLRRDKARLVELKNRRDISPDEMVDFFFDTIKQDIIGRMELSFKDGSLLSSERGLLLQDLNTDLGQVLSNAFTTKIVRTLEYNQGGWELSKISVPNTDKGGFLGIEKYVPGLAGNMFIMSNSAIGRDGRRHNFISKGLRAEIESDIERGSMPVNSIEAKKEYYQEGTTRDLEKNKDVLAKEHEEFSLVSLDEGTDILIKVNDASVGAIREAFMDRGSEFRQDLEAVVDMGNPRIVRRLEEIFDLGDKRDSKIAEAITTIRAVSDSPTKLEGYLLGNVLDSDLKSDWKRLKMYEPKSGFVGTADNIAFHYALMRKQSRDSERHAIAFEAVRNVFGEDGTSPFKILSIDDEMSFEGVDSFNPFDHAETAARRYDDGLDIKYTAGQIREMKATLEAGRTNVDAITYVSRDAFQALMSLIGVRDSMIEYDSHGGMTIKAGAIKPIFAHNDINRETGDISSFLLKTSIQYNPNLDPVFRTRSIHGITFKSANKRNETKNRAGEIVENYMPVNPMASSDLSTTTLRKVDSQIVLNYGDGRHVQDIPLESINIRQASREHDAVFGANTTIHWNIDGQAAATDWTQINKRMTTFENRMDMLWQNPISATAIARRVLGYSQEVGDQYLVNTGLDYIIQNDGLMASEWMIPILERSVISTYLDGGNISASRIRDGSSDVMTSEAGDLDLPVRRTVQVGSQERYVQQVFGGGRVSGFSAGKPLKIFDKTSLTSSGDTFNDNANDSHALIVRVGAGSEGIFVDRGKNGNVLYIDGFQISRDLKKRGEPIVVYDMAESMERKVTSESLIADSEMAFEIAEGKVKETLDIREIEGLSVGEYINKLEGLHGKEGQDVFLAGLKSRQPRNMAGDIVIEKVQGVSEGRGNVSETNSVDALTILDADFDFDKSSNYLSAPEGVWAEASRLSGHTVLASNKDIYNKINKQFEAFQDAVQHKGNVIETGLVRSRFVKMHQIMTYMNNMFGEGAIGEIGIGKNQYHLKLKRGQSNYLNTSDSITKYVKAFIDVYKDTPSNWNSKEFVQDSMRDIWFGEDGLFRLEKISGSATVGSNEILNLRRAEYQPVIEAIEKNFIRPLGSYIQLNRGQDIDGGGYSRHAGLQEFASAYDKISFAFHPSKQGAYKNSPIDITTGLTASRDYFATKTQSPFDLGMRRLQELNAKKFRDVDPFQSDVGKLLRLIEEGEAYDVPGLKAEDAYQQQYNKNINNAFKNYVKNEMRAADVIGIRRRLDSVDNKIQEMKLRYKPELVEDYAEFKSLQNEQVKLAEALTDLEFMMGAGRDWQATKGEMFFEKAAYPFANKEPGHKNYKVYHEGEYFNHSTDPIVVIDKKNNIQEVIAPQKSNLNPIFRGQKFHKHGRRYEYSGEDQTGAYINHEAFSGLPTIYKDGAIREVMSEGEYGVYKDMVTELEFKLKDIDARLLPNHKDRRKLFLHPREHSLVGSERKAQLHTLIMKKFGHDASHKEASDLLRIHALFQKMLTPEQAKNIILAYPIAGSNVQKMAHMEKVYMRDFGRMEQLAIEYLKDIVNGTGYTDGPIGSKQAGDILKNIMYQQKLGYRKLVDPMGDHRLAMDGMVGSDTNIRNHYLFNENYLNKTIFEKFREMNQTEKDAANVLIGYTNGEGGMIDPVSMYRASIKLQKHLPANQVFFNSEKYHDGKSRNFGNIPSTRISRYWDNSKNLNRNYGRDGVIKEKPVDYWKRKSECIR